MTISNTTAAAATTPTGYTTKAAASPDTVTNPSANLGESDFLTMLVTQLENQDPTNPTSNTDMIAEMSQFNSLAQLTDMNTSSTTANSSLSSLNTNIEALIAMQNTTQAASLIGKTVTVNIPASTASDGTAIPASTVTGPVSVVTFVNGTPMININGTTYGLSQVATISA
jgi:flagellar basal-body rod modification protein FlgD